MNLKDICLVIIYFLFKREIFLINSPLQLINMVELINYRLIKTIGQIRSALAIQFINKEIKLVFLSENINIFFVHNFLRLRKFLLFRFNISYIGDYKYYLFREICKISKEKWIVDDGASTLDFNYFNKIKISKSNFFTIFKISSKINQVENKYIVCKKNFKRKVVKKGITFVGDAVVEKDLIDKKIFLKKLKLFSKKNKDSTIYYYPHRKEKVIFDNLDMFHNIRIISNNLNIELYLLHKSYLTQRFVSFYSSALFTIKRIVPKEYNIKFQYMSFNDKYINREFILINKNTKKRYKKEGIKLIKC